MIWKAHYIVSLTTRVTVSSALNNLPRIAELLRYSTSKKIIEEFLRGKSLAFSNKGWDDLIANRLLKYVDENLISENDLLGLLSSVEEVGRQHVFLYRCDPDIAIKLLDKERVHGEVAKIGMTALLVQPLALDTPDSPTLVDIRLQEAEVPLSLTVKEVYSHEAVKLSQTQKTENRMVKTFEIVRTRAVNVAKLHRDGLLEIRLASVSEQSYKEQRDRFEKHLGDLIPIHQFGKVDFTIAKEKLSDRKSDLSEKVRFADTILKNANGTTVKVMTGSRDDDLAQDKGAVAGEDAFLAHHDGYPDGHNFFLKAVPGVLSKDILILLSGESHEFGVIANCEEPEYNYVLRELTSLNS